MVNFISNLAFDIDTANNDYIIKLNLYYYSKYYSDEINLLLKLHENTYLNLVWLLFEWAEKILNIIFTTLFNVNYKWTWFHTVPC